MLLSILAHMPTYDDARAIVQKLMSALPSGSYLTVSDATNTSEAIREAERVWNESIKPPYNLRSPDEITGYFDGLELVEPGIVPVTQWRPDDVTGVPDHVDAYGGIGRKP